MFENIKKVDTDLASAMEKELERQRDYIYSKPTEEKTIEDIPISNTGNLIEDLYNDRLRQHAIEDVSSEFEEQEVKVYPIIDSRGLLWITSFSSKKGNANISSMQSCPFANILIDSSISSSIRSLILLDAFLRDCLSCVMIWPIVSRCANLKA
jgi:hypothetical protein